MQCSSSSGTSEFPFHKLPVQLKTEIINLDDMSFNSPQLHELSITALDHSPKILASCPQVTKLTLDDMSIEFCIDALLYLPNLTHGTFKNMTYEDDTLPRQLTFNDGSSIFVHESLTSLELIVEREDIAKLFLRSISCPSLTKFSIENWRSSDERFVLQTAAQFLRVSNCTLKQLKLKMDDLGSGSWPCVLMVFNCVHTSVEVLQLETYSSIYSSIVIPALMKRLSSPSYFPQLLRLTIRELCGPLDYADIHHNLKLREESWPSGALSNIDSTYKVILETLTAPPGADEENRSPEPNCLLISLFVRYADMSAAFGSGVLHYSSLPGLKKSAYE